jgi:hypothetical protein
MAERSMGYGLRALNRLAGSDVLDRIRIRKGVEKALFQGTKNGFRTATAAGRTFKSVQQLGKPARQKKGKSKGLFDLTPDDEQQMFQEAGRAFAADQIRPAALKADEDRETPKEILDQAAELGVAMLGVPEELGGVMTEQAAVTSVLIAEARRYGHRLRRPRPRRRRHRDRPLGQRRAGGDLPARLHRRGRPRRRAGAPRAAPALRPLRAGDEGEEER